MSETTKQTKLNIIEAFWQIYADNPVFFIRAMVQEDGC